MQVLRVFGLDPWRVVDRSVVKGEQVCLAAVYARTTAERNIMEMLVVRVELVQLCSHHPDLRNNQVHTRYAVGASAFKTHAFPQPVSDSTYKTHIENYFR